ncbi:hypothetical protein KIN20_031838 [Parelaphostrongylus tenuis]|uniref:Uncharacterized protein n=1 Tax=Parelaphostrongylus tenuis TaxID=148309 RepID=A0AAD5R5N0_PARTN|nr:hypothetical protein KIN20_031838 [Parelaphostrongylus tenuis]
MTNLRSVKTQPNLVAKKDNFNWSQFAENGIEVEQNGNSVEPVLNETMMVDESDKDRRSDVINGGNPEDANITTYISLCSESIAGLDITDSKELSTALSISAVRSASIVNCFPQPNITLHQSSERQSSVSSKCKSEDLEIFPVAESALKVGCDLMEDNNQNLFPHPGEVYEEFNVDENAERVSFEHEKGLRESPVNFSPDLRSEPSFGTTAEQNNNQQVSDSAACYVQEVLLSVRKWRMTRLKASLGVNTWSCDERLLLQHFINAK